MTDLDTFARQIGEIPASPFMPAVFLGHGSPMNAIAANDFTASWQRLGRNVPRPNAILSISAHWLTPGSIKVLSTSRPRTIHDFGGFPDELYRQQYPAPGSPEYATQTIALLEHSHAAPDENWGLDHGTWSVLKHVYPNADVPVYQLSIDYSRPPRWHYELAQQLSQLRRSGVLVLGSGNVVHNLQTLRPGGQPYDWALEFDEMLAARLQGGDVEAAVDMLDSGPLARLAHPTHDHYLPLLYVLGLRDPDEMPNFFTTGFDLGSVSMRSVGYGLPPASV